MMRVRGRIGIVVLAGLCGGIGAGCTSLDKVSGTDAGRDVRDVAAEPGGSDEGDDVAPRDTAGDPEGDADAGTDVPDVPSYEPCLQGNTCPDGMVCRTVRHAGQEDARLCVPGPDLLCAPCLEDTDCRPDGVETADLCVGTAEVGRFCAIDCTIGDGCPDGYTCLRPSNRPSSVKQCVPKNDAECACPPAAVERNLATSCTRTNDVATCTGQRRCTSDGLTACDARDAMLETCNNVDDNCDGNTDEGVVFDDCARQWGTVMCFGSKVCEGGVPICKAGPPVTETCNGVDDDCDGDTDEDGTPDCKSFYKDDDQDGYGAGEARCGCGLQSPWNATVGGDCNDGDLAVHPGATEVCDGIDNDCDDRIDPPDLPDCTVAYVDLDGDGYGDPATQRCDCGAGSLPLVADGTDCDDADIAVHPGAAEVCNGKDDDCDWQTDDGPDRGGCEIYRQDDDLDGFGSVVDGPCLCHSDGVFVTTVGGDCDDTTGDRKPGAAEVCNDLDDDCDGSVDEDFDCDPGTVGTEHCGLCGTHTRICGGDCHWPAEWSECTETGICTPGDLQTCPVGCGNFVCSDGCQWPTECTWTKDSHEPNDTRAAARYLGYFDEEDDPPPNTIGWIHGPDDVDWYSFRADEEWPFFPPVDTDDSLVAAVTLNGGVGNHVLCIYWDDNSDGGIDETTCVSGTGRLYAETPNVDPGLIEDASGTVYASVSGDPGCTPYTLSWYWD